MSYIELDDGILDHPKLIRAAKLGGSEAVHLWLGLRAYCAKLLTDGFVPDDMLDEVRGPKDPRKRAIALQALREVQLLDPAPSGVQLHNYLKHSKSRAVILAQREAARARQTKFRGGNGDGNGGSNAAGNAAGNAPRNGVTNASPTPSVTIPSPLLSTPLHSTPDESGARAPEVPKSPNQFPDSPETDDPKLTICPLDLREKAESAGILRDFVDKYQAEPEQIREVIREFVSYWSIGGGVGRKHANWPRKLREHLRRACEKPGGLKPIGELEHEQHGGGGPSRGVRAAKAADAAAMALMREAHATGGK